MMKSTKEEKSFLWALLLCKILHITILHVTLIPFHIHPCQGAAIGVVVKSFYCAASTSTLVSARGFMVNH